MNTYSCTDDGSVDIKITAETAREAAEEYVKGGDWGDGTETIWVTVAVTLLDAAGEPADEPEHITVTIEADEPSCEGDAAHDWQSPYSLLGGIKENPGVQGHGAGVIITEVCACCGKYRVTDTYAQDPSNGRQGLRSVAYQDATEESEEWVASLTAENR